MIGNGLEGSQRVRDATTAATWVALLAGVAGVLLAGWRLWRQGSPAGGRNRQLAVMVFGLVILLNTVPRLVGASSGVNLLFGVIALLPLAGFVVLLTVASRA
jgi:hypothetical protein